VLLLDTAGRLHVDDELMQELRELKAEVKPHETLLVVDAMTGQDAVQVATSFRDGVDFDALVLTRWTATRAAARRSRSGRSPDGRAVSLDRREAGRAGALPSDRIASRILGMGDVLTLVERAEQAASAEQQAKFAEKVRRDSFTLEDFQEQLQAIKKMGPLEDLLRMIPGVGAKIPADAQVDEKGMKRVKRSSPR